MKRLTFRTDSGSVIIHPDFVDDPDVGQKLVNRLAAYEETGMDPEEIERIADAYGRGMTLRQETGERIEIIREIKTDRLRELAQADKEGKVLILPCKVGDIVYRIWNMPECEPAITTHVIEDVSQIMRWTPSIGRITFLTYEDAERALAAAVAIGTQKIYSSTKEVHND